MSAHDARAGDSGSSGRHPDRAGALRRWPAALALVAMWIALWGRFSIANVLGGAIVALTVLAVAREARPRPVQHFHAIPALRFLATFIRQLVMANYHVAIAVLRPDRIRPGILAIPLHHVSDAVATLVANSITLTPGTLTLEVERRGDTAILYVHALDLTNDDAVRAGISDLGHLAVAAFGGREAQARSVAERAADEVAAAGDDTTSDVPTVDPPPGTPSASEPRDTA